MDTERAWAAGFFDGEGSVARTVSRNGRPTVPRVSITQAGPPDAPPETLLRFATAVGVSGRLYGPTFIENRKPRYVWAAGKYADVLVIRDALWPWLSTVKRDVFTERLTEYEEKRATPIPRSRPWTHCKNGHELVPENLYISGTTRRCRICQIAQSREQRRRVRGST